jgi:hypothetical protein
MLQCPFPPEAAEKFRRKIVVFGIGDPRLDQHRLLVTKPEAISASAVDASIITTGLSGNIGLSQTG